MTGLESKSTVLGSGQVDLKLSSGNVLTLHNVLYVPSGNVNLISGTILMKLGYKIVCESNKAVITFSGSFIGKGYVDRGLIRLSLFPCSDRKSVV